MRWTLEVRWTILFLFIVFRKLDGSSRKMKVLLFLFLAGCGFVTGQLYTDLDDLAKHHNIPLGSYPVSPPRERVTCMARVPLDLNGNHQKDFIAETRDFYRGGALGYHSSYNPHYFCANVPKMGKGHRREVAIEEGYRTPYSQFWLQEETSHHWSERADSGGQDESRHRLMKAKDMGFIFRVDVTGIRVGGRFLKGWYHVKIRLDIDHNGVKNAKAKDYVIDKLVVTARGRMLIAGKYYKKHERGPPRRAWVGGIGEFVKDFPKCEEAGWNPKEPYLTQQFMPCGAVQYSESQYGNNFYYSRGWSGGDARYGRGQGEAVKEIHLNFRLDNSFCNRYYDLDFIANGIVMHETLEVGRIPRINIEVGVPDPDKTFMIQRSISTRFVFISSHADHGPSYWENADPIPRGVDSVTCSEELKGVQEMKTVGELENKKESYKGPETRCQDMPQDRNGPPEEHIISVTEGAALKANENASADATSSFGGSIKFIYNVPGDLTVITAQAKAAFAARRTWTYPEVFRNNEGGSFWGIWKDSNYTPITNRLVSAYAIHTAVQRVLHEFDWETWRELGRTGGNYSEFRVNMDNQLDSFVTRLHRRIGGNEVWQAGNPVPEGGHPDPTCSWCSLQVGEAAGSPYDKFGVQYWPHPYYDGTCVGLDIKAEWDATSGRPLKRFRTLYYNLEPKYRDPEDGKKTLNKNEVGYLTDTVLSEMPPILGRCNTGLYWNPGIGRLDNAPPPCNEFFGDYGEKTVDPALKRVIQATEGSSRPDWFEKYGPEGKHHQTRLAFCGVVDKLKKEFPYCPSIPAQPFTPTPSPILVAKKEKEFKTTRAYNRGMMVAENPYSLYVYDSRVLHGLVMTIIVMFITPISIFLVRYFKETFMDSRLFLHKIWYFVHVGAAFLIPLLFLVAMWRLVEARAILGVSLSKTGKTHRVFGWVAILIAVLLASLGGIRCMNRTLRGIIIFLHFILGFAFYFISLGLIMVSVAIPGSPAASSNHDFSVIGTVNHGEKRGAELWYLGREPIFLILTGWILFDLVVNIVLTVMQCCNDYKMELTEHRICFGAAMPVLSENFRFDTPGRFFRIWALRLYVCVAFGVTIAICVLIRLNSPRGRGFGFMSCTHTPDLNVAITYLEPCLRVDTTDEAINAVDA